ncbi:MAG TPA: carboxylesterase/lipase family protein [Bacteroidota bacterium]|nr:carboxylesterase/lipase family protein [Bacteroidota bacterium]
MKRGSERIGAIIVLAAGALVSSAAAQTADTLIAVEGGTIRGTTAQAGSGVRVFRGIPYARPPVGALRWKPPQPVEAWSGTRDCAQFGPSCIQPDQKVIRGITGPKSEDCLYLNVWTAAPKEEARPVIVWIHGGGFAIGSGAQALYGGLSFARDGAVEVTINYRLGPFGFMAHPALSAESPDHVSGNYGLLDMIQALRWVHDNIAAFGGDPANVTIFGESAGSVAVGCLIASPLARGLFHRAIMESGVAASLPPLHRQGADDSLATEATGVAIARQAGLDDSAGATEEVAARLRAIPAEALLQAASPRVGLFGSGRKMGPAIDGYVLPREPLEIYASGEGNIVPVLIGTNADEGTLFLPEIPIRKTTGYVLAARRLFGEYADEVLRMFPVRTDSEVRPAIARLVTISSFIAPARRAARAMSTHNPNVWMYHFTRVAPPLSARGLGATHGAEIFYVFKPYPDAALLSGQDETVSDAMHAAWLQFARTGNPAIDGGARWPAYTSAKDAYMEFGDRIGEGSGLDSRECDLFDKIASSWRQMRHFSR